MKKTLAPIVPLEDFFYDAPDLPYKPLAEHSLEQSPCYPIIGSKVEGRYKVYYCELHPKGSRNINLSSVEQHCKYSDPETHKAQILLRVAENIREGLGNMTLHYNAKFSTSDGMNKRKNEQFVMHTM